MTAIIPVDLVDRILLKITVDPDSGCWVYPTSATDGYARVTVRSDSTRSGYTTVRPSRVVYEAQVGPIPEGLELDHVRALGCTSTACCNPAHLEPVTGRENKLRGDTVLAANLVKTRCPAGHDYDETNTYIYPNGSRSCRACKAEYQRSLRRQQGDVGPENSVKTHCPQNHPYDDANTKISADGSRRCLECRREYDRARGRRTSKAQAAAASRRYRARKKVESA
jgi:hypothetical protein